MENKTQSLTLRDALAVLRPAIKELIDAERDLNGLEEQIAAVPRDVETEGPGSPFALLDAVGQAIDKRVSGALGTTASEVSASEVRAILDTIRTLAELVLGKDVRSDPGFHPRPWKGAVWTRRDIYDENELRDASDGKFLKRILPSFDRETIDFFRWSVSYNQSELSGLIRTKSGMDFGSILDLIPVQRGPSGRIVRLRIVGSKKTLVVGKELEIRKWLSPSHLYSSAFVVLKSGAPVPESFKLHGAGWGHGVGLCQIGAAVMATKGKKAKEILLHYFKGAEVRKVY